MQDFAKYRRFEREELEGVEPDWSLDPISVLFGALLTGTIRNQVDQIWETFWIGGVSNPLSVIEQITYLLFAKRLDDIQSNKEAKANTLGEEEVNINGEA